MAMRIQNTFTVELPIEQAWPMLLDVPSIVPCMPGAELIESLPDNTYKGKVSLKLGPVVLAFQGIAKLIEVDTANRLAKLDARGTDQRGRGGANAKVVFILAPRDGNTQVQMVTELQLSGTVAQYGRAQGVIKDVAEELVGQFSECLAKKIRTTSDSGARLQSDAERADQAEHPNGASQSALTQPLSGFWLVWRVFLSRLRALLGRGGRS
ncbi:MAG: SRPBCC family protein [Hyphomicrobiaceae bacterium]